MMSGRTITLDPSMSSKLVLRASDLTPVSKTDRWSCARTTVKLWDVMSYTLTLLWCVFVAYGIYVGPDALLKDGALLGLSSASDNYVEVKYAEKGEYCGLRWLGRGNWPLAAHVDKFLFVHAISTLEGTFALRDVRVVWFLSIFCEFIELSFAHVIPNFRECFWDSMFLDIFGTNFLGIVLGSLVIKFFGLRPFDLLGVKGQLDGRKGGKLMAWAVSLLCVLMVCQGHLCSFVFKHVVSSKSKRWTLWWAHGFTHMAMGRPCFEALYQRFHLAMTDVTLAPVALFFAMSALDWAWVVRMKGTEFCYELFTQMATNTMLLWPLGFVAMALVAYHKVSTPTAIVVLCAATAYVLVDLYGY